MGLLPSLARLLGIEVEVLVQRAAENAVAVAAIALFGLIGFGFLVAAAYLALTLWVSPLLASLIMAASALVIALVLYVALRIQQAAARKRAAARQRDAETTALVAGAALAALPDLLDNPLVRNIGLPLAIYAALLLLSHRGKDSSGDDDQ